MTDLFGQEVEEPRPRLTKSGKRKRDETPRGYSAPPGTGPAGETCSSCKFFCRVKFSKTYFKCGLMHRNWSACYATDIRARALACRNWSPPDPVEWRVERIEPYRPPGISRHGDKALTSGSDA